MTNPGPSGDATLAIELLIDGFSRVQETVHRLLDGAGADLLLFRPDPRANSIAWLIWHLSRVQDDHIADLANREQLWNTGGWERRFGLPVEANATGYGDNSDQVGAVRAGADLLGGYYDAVHAGTLDYLHSLAATDFSRIVDTSWDPPVTLAVRLVSILNDDTQHVGQAAYLRGLAERAGQE